MIIWDSFLIPDHILYTTVCDVQRTNTQFDGKKRLGFNSDVTQAFYSIVCDIGQRHKRVLHSDCME